MSRQKKLRYVMCFLFTVLLYWRVAFIPLFQKIDQAAWMFGISSIFGSRFPVALGLGIAFPFLVCVLSFAFMNKDIYRIQPLKLGLSVLLATGIYSLALNIAYKGHYRLWFAFKDIMTAGKEAILWTTDSIAFALIIGLCAVLFYALLRFSARKPALYSFPCKKGMIASLLIIAAIIKLLENICTPPRSLIFGTFSSEIGFRWIGQIVFLLNTVTISAMFIVAYFADIRMRSYTDDDS